MNQIRCIVLLISAALLLPLFGGSQNKIQKIPDKLVVLTFDDASISQYSFVAPLLKKHGFGATFFVCEFPPNFSDNTKYMSWKQMKLLDDMGFEIANHTRTHPAVANISKEELLKELVYIENKCDSMEIQKPVSFAYPGYSLSEAVVEVLAEKEYRFARAGGNRAYDPAADHPLLIPSWSMVNDNNPQIMQALDQAKDGKIVVLTIHGVPDIEHPWVTTSPELFEEYVKFLADNHFTVIAMRDLKKYVRLKDTKFLEADFEKPLRN
ncbi:polysaccharide deacetylase family protein [Maribellus sp. YY47]|uniref:polysaccharide deacetylase family protein n=1 Tax=Maribellus sp. YY47 TaxID=2929486 RepID=UPI002001622C|nr:polysaccharide deacetylase family protein [Maribellus sp. YY47]MCK3683895.1 polysaccharide deacetylase family protein [Maribellus sp. YY47]